MILHTQIYIFKSNSYNSNKILNIDMLRAKYFKKYSATKGVITRFLIIKFT